MFFWLNPVLICVTGTNDALLTGPVNARHLIVRIAPLLQYQLY